MAALTVLCSALSTAVMLLTALPVTHTATANGGEKQTPEEPSQVPPK